MNKLKLLAGVFILVFNQLSAVESKFIYYPFEDDTLKVKEKVYLHIDRENYLAGDDIWFKAYLIDALDHLLTNHSNNLHVELISPSSKIISSKIIRLEGGLGNGDFKLSADIMSGRYSLRAYTNYMRNFSDELFFTKEISVINAKGSELVSPESTKYIENKIQISFFPEGGSMIDNVASVVAFKSVDNLDNGQDVSGRIYSSNGDLITKFKSSHRGMGTFLLRPLPGLKYYCKVKGADSIDFRYDLPESFQRGISLSTSFNQDNELIITAKTNSESLATFLEQDLLLIISVRKEIINTIPFRIKSQLTSFVVPTGYLPEGIISLTLTTRDNLPLSERLVYLERETPLKILIGTDKQTYKKREPVNLKISLSGDSAIERMANISLAAIDETFTNSTSQYPRNISSWFLLESDIRGNVEDPSYYFDPSNKERLRDLDLLLRTQGWRDFSWKYDSVTFPAENGFTVSGRLKITSKNQLIEDSRVSIGIFGDQKSLVTYVPVDSNGRFELQDIDFTGQVTVIASGIDNKNILNGKLSFDSFRYDPANIPDLPGRVKVISVEKQSSIKTYYLIGDSIKRKYKLNDTINIGEVNIISERRKEPQTIKIESSRSKYGTPEAELIITEAFKGYNSLPELMSGGRIPGVEVSGKYPNLIINIRGAFSLQPASKTPSMESGTLPLILVDGNPVPYEEINLIPVNFIDRIDVLKSVGATSVFGMRAASGVINLITKTGESSEIETKVEHTSKIIISGYYAPRIFYSPQHLPNSGTDYKPDLRNTLLWNPDINLSGNAITTLDFYNGDNSAKIKIHAEGITMDGIPITGETQYEVR
jgi:hypothetical protein